MIVKKYKAATDTEAILLAKEDLGPNAVVLNVKQMKQRGIAKLFKKDFVEITAALEEKEFEENVNNRQTKVSENISNGRPSFDYKVNDTIAAPSGISNDYGSGVMRKGYTASNHAAPSIIEEKLDNLHDMLQNQMNSNVAAKQQEPETETEEQDNTVFSAGNANFKSLKLIYSKLLDSEMDEKYVNSIINDIETSMKKEANLDTILASVYQKIILKLGEPQVIEDDERRKIIFFIGPTGVGKTTTIAKIASDFKINKDRNIGFITADTYRIAAVEQLNTYAGILDAPVNVIYSPSEICETIDEMDENDAIFIDTAGMSHKNTEQKSEVVELIENVRNADYDADIIIFLVLSVTTKYKDLINITNAYKEIDDIRLLFTKMDETEALGNILNVRCYTGAPLSYATMGQNVPDDIEKIDVQGLAKSLLGGK